MQQTKMELLIQKKYSKGLQKICSTWNSSIPWKLMQEYQSANDEDIASFIGGVEQLISSGTIKNLIDAKAQGATFGALSDRELGINCSIIFKDW